MAFYIFDVDGVLTDEHARPNKDVLHTIEKLHQQDHQLAFITGRSRQWLAENIFSVLDSQDWSSLYCVAEHGAIKGKGPDIKTWELDRDFVVSDEVKEKLLKISKQSRFEGLIEWDDTKESMGTVESIHGNPGDQQHLEKTRQALKDYAEEAKEIADEYGKKVVVSTYGVDVIPPNLSKKIGTEWVFKQPSVSNGPVYVFGDGKGDLVMAETAKEYEFKDVTFFWVGDGETPESENNKVKSKKSSEKYAAGTIEFLNELVE
ncbi:HAD hydrolase family protein [Pseudalkalibacillus caeni]|uniref:HAD family phosphatase n=1 Tax=Exobacillus caeni TaxID=2574798 RepID=A0A5R9F630_9BACL|nr:HAD hydrolase family protein [Pseudalkalibacillus caeni]TLS38481.1 HAD family phosphatase [Pseudalkalibacillus caeni]